VKIQENKLTTKEEI